MTAIMSQSKSLKIGWLWWSAYKEFSKKYISNLFFFTVAEAGGRVETVNETPV